MSHCSMIVLESERGASISARRVSRARHAASRRVASRRVASRRMLRYSRRSRDFDNPFSKESKHGPERGRHRARRLSA